MIARALNGYWGFQAPIGYRYVSLPGRGKMLKRDEPVASVVQEALEGLASGRFESQAELMRWLQDNLLFPKNARGIVRHHRIGLMLEQSLYAGYIEVPSWGVELRPAQHEGLISFSTYKRIKDRIYGASYAPRQKNLNEDFPLRGFVVCDDCDTPLTGGWSSGTHKRYPYYLCLKKGCASNAKSVRREVIEDEFELLIRTVQPSAPVFRVAEAMFRDLWEKRTPQGTGNAKALAAQLTKVESQVEQLLERILDASVPSVIAAYENKVRRLEEEKLLIAEKMASAARPATSYDDALRTALGFLSSPCNLWQSERLEDRRTVLKLTFAERLLYVRGSGLRTAKMSLPFRVMSSFYLVKKLWRTRQDSNL